MSHSDTPCLLTLKAGTLPPEFDSVHFLYLNIHLPDLCKLSPLPLLDLC